MNRDERKRLNNRDRVRRWRANPRNRERNRTMNRANQRAYLERKKTKTQEPLAEVEEGIPEPAGFGAAIERAQILNQLRREAGV